MVKPVTEAERAAIRGTLIKQHPDGKPWTKCCLGADDTLYKHSCQCFMRKPIDGLSRHDSALNADGTSRFNCIDQLKAEKGRFFCCHRRDGEYHRECAGWAAKFSGNRP